MATLSGGIREAAVGPIHHAGPLVTVVIPCYNDAHFLPDAIASVLRQTYGNVEIIVVDDGSTDETEAVAARYGVRCIRQHNQGLAAARNTGLWASNGGYVIFLDADDLLLPQAIESGLDCFKTHPECAFVYGQYRYTALDGTVLWDRRRHADQHPYRALLSANFISMCATVLFRRDILESVGGFDPSLKYCEDYELYLRITWRFPITGHDEVVAAYRIHDSNMSRNAEAMMRTALRILERQLPLIGDDLGAGEAYRRGVSHRHATYAVACLLRGRIGLGIKYLAPVVWQNPRYFFGAFLPFHTKWLARKLTRSFAAARPPRRSAATARGGWQKTRGG